MSLPKLPLPKKRPDLVEEGGGGGLCVSSSAHDAVRGLDRCCRPSWRYKPESATPWARESGAWNRCGAWRRQRMTLEGVLKRLEIEKGSEQAR